MRPSGGRKPHPTGPELQPVTAQNRFLPAPVHMLALTVCLVIAALVGFAFLLFQPRR